ncbi:unnamed protein product [Cylicocyclus nassatus]|uniref:Uncharacterized protein n=1 Tax=Cylicocyclus nassatus TaxID=53992 RepID=A0AA36DI82_CYLNA|nr:unnamed protein product [Cylicocyclus nassatus]
MVVAYTCKKFTLSMVILTATQLVLCGDEVPPKPTALVSTPVVRWPAAHNRQIAAYSPTGVVHVYTIIREKATINRTMVDQEKMAAFQAHLRERIQWDDEEPPGGWTDLSKLNITKKQGSGTGTNQKRSAVLSLDENGKAWIEKRKAEGEKHFKTVYGYLKFIPKPGSEAEKEFAKRAAPFMEQINKELADENAPWMQEVMDSPFVRFD